MQLLHTFILESYRRMQIGVPPTARGGICAIMDADYGGDMRRDYKIELVYYGDKSLHEVMTALLRVVAKRLAVL